MARVTRVKAKILINKGISPLINLGYLMFKELPANKLSIAKRKLVNEVGNNDADYVTHLKINGKNERCPFYRTWHNMLLRCYSEEALLRRPTYMNCLVVDEWLTFSNFKLWMEKQDWQNKVLDKDIIKPNNKIYSPNFCVFVPEAINNLLTDRGNDRGNYPIGVDFNKNRKKFRARCNINGKNKHLGYFTTPEEASEVYKKFKYNLITKTANEQTDLRIKQGLLEHAEILLSS